MKKILFSFILFFGAIASSAQINTDKVLIIGRNALYYEDYVLAIQYFNQVIQAKPYLSEPYYFRAVAKFLLDDSKGAEDDCSLCLDQNPFFSKAYSLRGDARLNQNKYGGAIADYSQVIKDDPDNQSVLVHLGMAYTEQKDYENAEKTLSRLVDSYPKYTEGRLTRGQMYLQKGDTIRALGDYNKAIEGDKYFAQSYSMRGLLFYYKKDYDKSLADLDEAVNLDPANVGNYINRGLSKYSKNDLRGAMADYDHVVEIDPTSTIARFNRGLLRAQVGANNQAIADFDVVLQREPSNFIAYFNRSLLLSKIGKYRAALSDLNKVLVQYPDFYQGFYNRSEIKRKQGDLSGAEKDVAYARKEEKRIQKEASQGKLIDEKTREKSDNTISKFNLLVVADKTDQEKNKYSEKSRGRVQDRQVKVELEPKFVLTFYEKLEGFKKTYQYCPLLDQLNGKGLLKQKIYISNNERTLTEDQIQKHFASITEYSEQIGKDETNPNLYFGRGMDYLMLRDLPNAQIDFEKVIQLDPSQPLAYFNLAVIHSKLFELNENVKTDDGAKKIQVGGPQKEGLNPYTKNDLSLPTPELEKSENRLAILNYAKTISLSPSFAEAYYNRAELESKEKDYRVAIQDYSESIKINPSFAEAYYNRGLDRLAIGDKNNGLDDLRKAGELGIFDAYSVVKRMTE